MILRHDDSPLKICIVSREYPPETLWGGIGTFTLNLAHGLKNIGHEVDVVAFSQYQDSLSEDNGIRIHRIVSPAMPFLKKTLWEYANVALSPFAYWYSKKISVKIEELYKEQLFDIIDFPEHIGEGFCTIRKNLYPTAVRLFTPLSLIGKLGMNKVTNNIDYYLIGLLEKASIRSATAVNSPSDNLAGMVKQNFKINREIEIIYNPIDTEKFSPTGGIHSSLAEPLRVVFAGRLEDRKGVHILAQAIPKVLQAVHNAQFDILGHDCAGVFGYSSMKAYMISVLRDHGAADNVNFIDPISYDALPGYYGNGDVSVVPSLYDNSPYTCLEAMSCGLPVIGTSAGGMPEYIDNGINGIVIPPNDSDALACALIDLLSHHEKRQDFGKQARKKSLTDFKREIISGKMVTFYRKTILHHKHGTRPQSFGDIA
ncbi:MAG: glycosyltransferase family 4 protein [Deltaproteobacteria bacterium]